MAWIKTASRQKSNWVQTSDSARVHWRSRWVFFRDGLIAGVVLGVLVGVCSDWPGAKWASKQSGWTTRMRDVSDQIK